MAENSSPGGFNGCLMVVFSRKFWINALLIGLFFLACIAITTIWLKGYTKHDQQLELPDYIGQDFEEASEKAADESFRMVVLDSIHVVGKPGNIILQQNPPAGSLVKENRTVYVTTTKKSADLIPLSLLPVLYGKLFEQKKRELFQGYAIESVVVGERYDSGEPGHILAVIYQGDTIIDRRERTNEVMIEKGGRMEFIVSKNTGGELRIPDLVCLTYAEARFLVRSSGLNIGEVITDGTIGVIDSAYVSGQVPDPAEGTMRMGETIKLSLSAQKPYGCY